MTETRNDSARPHSAKPQWGVTKGPSTCRVCGEPIDRTGNRRFMQSDGVKGTWKHIK